MPESLPRATGGAYRFLRSVGLLVGGTAFAQALMVLILPLLTRLYSPADFTVLAAYAALLGLLASVACLRLEIAIPMPEADEEAVQLLVLALLGATAMAAFCALVIGLWPKSLAAWMGQPRLAPYLWLLPPGIWLAGTYAALQMWATRHGEFAGIATTRLSQALASAGVQLGMGWAGLAPVGLLLGQMLNSGAGVIGLGRHFLRGHRAVLAHVRLTRLRGTWRDYQRFPRYSTAEALANNGAVQLPVLIIAALAAGPEAGLLLLASRVMGAPMALLGAAVGQVYLAQAPEQWRQGQLGPFTAAVIGGLFKVGVGPLLFAGIVAPALFALVFGPQWARAGQFVSWMTPWFVLQLLSSPVSMTLHVTGRQQAAFALHVGGLLVRVGAVLAALQWAAQVVVEIYALASFAFYAVYLLVVTRAAGIRRGELYRACRAGGWIVAGWLLAAAAVHAWLVQGG